MKELLIISGKGGTGKTTVAAALADLGAREKKMLLVDADVDAANLELLLMPEVKTRHFFNAGYRAKINSALCSQCGRCLQVCRFDAIENTNGYRVIADMCEGCRACYYQCPSEAIQIEENASGEWYQSWTPFGLLFHAMLFPGEGNSGKLVSELKLAAQSHAQKHKTDILLIDGPPGTGCPVTAACRGVDLAVLVTEPTLTGQHDLKRILEVSAHFRVPTGMVINKCDLNPDIRVQMQRFAESRDIPLLGEVPYDEQLIEALSAAQPVTQVLDNAATDAIKSIWKAIKINLSHQ